MCQKYNNTGIKRLTLYRPSRPLIVGYIVYIFYISQRIHVVCTTLWRKKRSPIFHRVVYGDATVHDDDFMTTFLLTRLATCSERLLTQ